MSRRAAELLGVSTLLALAAVGALTPEARAQPAAPAQEASVPARPGELPRLTAAQATALALERSRDVALADAQVALARERLERLSPLRNPELRVRNLSTRYLTERFDGLEVGLRWRPPVPGESELEQRKAAIQLAERRAEAQRLRADLSARVARAHARAVAEEALCGLQRRHAAAEARRSELVEGLVALGQRSVLQRTGARAALRRARAAQRRAEQRVADARRGLALELGLTEVGDLEPEPVPVVLLSSEELQDLLRRHRVEPELAQAGAALERDRLRHAAAGGLPWFSFVEVNYRAERDQPDSAELLFGVELPLFSGSGWLAGATAAGSGGDEAAPPPSQGLERAATAAYDAYRRALLDYDLARQEANALEEDAARVTQGAAEHATLAPDEVLTLQVLALEGRAEEWARRLAVDEALGELCRTLGVASSAALAARGAGRG